MAAVAMLAGCTAWEHEERPAWRVQAEEACLAQKLVHVTAYVEPAPEINGPGICGLVHPFKVAALAGDTIALGTAQTLSCPMLPALDRWLIDVVQPVAQARFGQPVVEIKSLGSYGCRSMNNQRGAALSEHAFANAMDIGGFGLADGRIIDVMKGWNGDERERAFLHDVHQGACAYFNTVLGPGSDAFHYNHIHVDLARHGVQPDGTMRRICKPLVQPSAAPNADVLPDAPPLDDPALVSQVRPLADPNSPYPRSAIPTSSSVRRRPDFGAPAYVPEGSSSDWDLTSSVTPPPE